MMLKRFFGLGMLVFAMAAVPASAKDVTMASLLDDMGSMRSLAEFPDPPYTCKQFSSYDRASKSPKEDWFANNDFAQYLRVEDKAGRKEYVMMDADGPGAIVRIWSANPQGTLRIYIDGADTPAVEAPMQDLLGGKVPGFPPPIACETSKGWNSYLPIPYAKHCKVTSDNGKFYYHVNYRTYPSGTNVVSFAKGTLTSMAAEIEEVAKRLASPREGARLPADRNKVLYEVTVEPGKTHTLTRLDGGKAICGFLANVSAKDRVQALRKLVVRMVFDKAMTVNVPIGDFFGAAPGINPYESFAMGVTADGDMWSHWFMPFEESAVIEFHNFGDESIAVKGGVSTVPYKWHNRSMRFHAGWRTEFDVPTRPMQDWRYLQTEGKGVFVGVSFAIANPVKQWWGEGDEKIYVDGETFPSHFGTGTEDYYGYAWCSNVPFTHAYHNQPRCDGPGNYGHTSVNRWHILDRIPYTRDFRFDMELWHWHETCKVTMSVTAYWYALGASKGGVNPIRAEDLRIVPIPELKRPKVKGAIEGEKMKILAKTAEVGPQEWEDASGGSHLWWRGGGRPGDKLVLGFEVKNAGTYQVFARFLRAVDYGIVQLSINGQKAGGKIDLYNDGVKLSKEMDLGAFELKQGENRLTIEIVGANEKAKKDYMCGLDYLLLKPAGR
mgnify:CR=1 FL=1